MKMLDTVRRGAAALSAALLLSGCFSYRQAELEAVPLGENIRVHLTRLGAAALPEIPRQAGPMLRGRIMRNEDGRLLLRVPIAYQQAGVVTRELGRDIEVPVADIVRVETRELDRVRTALSVAGGIGVVVVLYQAFGGTRSDGGAPIPEPPVETIRIPLFHLPLR